jgi:DNA polymerase III epsilon subunit-like protein
VSAPLVFIDTETTSLRPDRRAWEIGLIVREPGKPDTEHFWFVDADHLDLANADLMSLKIGRFFDRHPQYRPGWDGDPNDVEDEGDVLRQVEAITRGAHLVGAVVSFDAEVLGNRMRANGICPSWHYHLCCVENLAVGYLSGSPAFGASGAGSKRAEVAALIQPPWKSDDLSAALGITVSEDERHTALGDARWALRIYDAVMGGGPCA